MCMLYVLSSLAREKKYPDKKQKIFKVLSKEPVTSNIKVEKKDNFSGLKFCLKRY